MSPSPATGLGSLLTYCTNVHPAETLDEILALLRGDVARVASRVRARERELTIFPIGLRLAAGAARELQDPERMQQLVSELEQVRGAVFTLNGFPYGAFHARAVKEQVYLPDWTSEARVTYTTQLFAVLARLLPEGHYGSVSTVPGQFKPHQSAGSREAIAQNLLGVCASLSELQRERGVELVLALEPEPGCLLETTSEAVTFFERELLSSDALHALATRLRSSPEQAEQALRRHLGICLDTCHAAVEFETSLGAYRQLRGAGIRVGKVQISAGLQVEPALHALERLRAFDEPVYLHQVVKSTSGGLRRFDDLPAALNDDPPGADEIWRVHFHVPLFTDRYGDFASTRADVAELLRVLGAEAQPPHLEVETYTWAVLPPQYRDRSLPEAIDAELCWAQAELTANAQLEAHAER